MVGGGATRPGGAEEEHLKRREGVGLGFGMWRKLLVMTNRLGFHKEGGDGMHLVWLRRGGREAMKGFFFFFFFCCFFFSYTSPPVLVFLVCFSPLLSSPGIV